MAKKRYYKRKFGKKGVRYIARSLNKYFKGKYPTYKSALPKAREINADLKSRNQKVILSNIFPYVRKSRAKVSQKKDYQITDELLVEQYYFMLVEYPQWIGLCSNNIYFHSKISPAGLPPIQGGTIPDEQAYFSDYISFCNANKRDADEQGEDGRYTQDWFVKCTEPVPDGKGNWKSDIISVDADGNPTDYGFDPNNPDFRPSELVLSEEVEPKEVSEEIADIPADVPDVPSKTKEDVEFIKAQVELAREERLKKNQDLMMMWGEMFRDGQITKSEYKQFMGTLKFD